MRPERNLQELKTAGDDAGEDLKTGAENAWSKVKTAFRNAPLNPWRCAVMQSRLL
jgi:hypothetical protein